MTHPHLGMTKKERAKISFTPASAKWSQRVERLTQHDRSRWAAASYPGLLHKDLKALDAWACKNVQGWAAP